MMFKSSSQSDLDQCCRRRSSENRRHSISILDDEDMAEVLQAGENAERENTHSETFSKRSEKNLEEDNGDDYVLFDISHAEEYEVPINFCDENDEEIKSNKIVSKIEVSLRNRSIETSQESKPMIKSVSMGSLSKAGDSKPKRRKSSLRKNLSYSSLSKLDDLSKDEMETPKLRRNVSFTSLEVREYDLTLGDNPSVRRGPPVSLSWNYSEGGSIDIEKWEEIRGPRRTKGEMIMGSYIRRSLLENSAGFSREEIAEATDQALKIKKNRNQSISRMHMSKLQDALESAKRKVKRIIPKTK